MDAFLFAGFILTIVLIPVLGIALLLYAIPLRIAATLVHSDDRDVQEMRISWGIIAFRIRGHGPGQQVQVLFLDHAVLSHTGLLEERKEEGRPDITPENLLGKDGTLQAGELIHLVQEITGPVGSFLSVLWQRSRFSGARGTLTFGLGNPSLTGEVFGYYWASRFILLASRIDIRMIPVFDRPVLEFDITVHSTIEHPLLILIAGIGLFRDPAIRRVIAGNPAEFSRVAGA
jgi:hypothetical protein